MHANFGFSQTGRAVGTEADPTSDTSKFNLTPKIQSSFINCLRDRTLYIGAFKTPVHLIWHGALMKPTVAF